ncbi:MAG: hypothetical protein P4M09_03030 [Devosia sp.]|nr:hypothetical protein [Devosia sp.]
MITGPSGRSYDLLPLDNQAGLPQSFPYNRDGVRYQFTVYANIPEAALEAIEQPISLPDGQSFLVVRVDRLASDGTNSTVFMRKVVPSLEYRAGALMLTFPTQVVARSNLNGVGTFGSNIVGGVASP